MVQLVVITQGGTTKTELDTGATPIELNYQFWDIEKPMNARSPYSFNFVLPFSKTNDAFFSHYYNTNTSDGTFTATVKTDCQLYVEGILVMEGILQLHSCEIDNQGYNVSILEQIANVFEVIKGMTFPQLFTLDNGTVDTDLDHALTWTNVKDSWNVANDITTGSVGAGTIVYPLADGGQGTAMNSQQAGTGYGFFYNLSLSGGALQGGGMNDQYLNVGNLKPAIRIAYLIEYIFERVGYTVSSNFFDSADFQKIYMFLALHTMRASNRPTYGFSVGLNVGIQLPSSGASTFYPISFTNESDPFYDPDALITGGYFTAPYDGVFHFTLQIVHSTSAGNVLQGYNIYTRLTVNGETPNSDQIATAYYQQVTVTTHNYTLQLDAGDVVQAWVSHTSASQNVLIQTTGAQTATLFTLDLIESSGGLVDVSANFPEVTVDRWLKAIFQRFNLIAVSYPDNPTVIEIEPWTTWWNEGTTLKDWTEVVDQDSIKIEPTTKYQKRQYLFKDAEGQNFLNQWWQHNWGYPKGQYLYINNNDFTTETETTEEVFQPYRNRHVFSNIQNLGNSLVPNVLLPSFWNWHDGSDGSIYLKEYVPNKPVLAYYNGLQDIGNGGTFVFGGTNYTTYPYFAEYNAQPVDEDTLCLNWGYDYPDNYYSPFVSGGTSAGITLNYAWRTYWSQMFNEIYGADSRIMTCRLNLSYTDLYNLKFNDQLYIGGCFWRVMQITNYSLTSDDLCEATLIKVLNAPDGRQSEYCNATPTTVNTNGTVNFVDASGSPVSPTETCCTLNGFVWDETNNQCFARDVSGGHGTGGGNGGGGIGSDGSNPTTNIENGLPISYPDFNHAVTEQYQQRQTIAGNISTQLYLRTTDATATPATLSSGISEFVLPPDNIVYIRLHVVAIEVGGSSATIGNTTTQNIQATVANTRQTAGARSVARTVGSTTTIAENKDTGVVARTDVAVTQSSAGDVAIFKINCTGDTNIEFQFFIDMELTTLQLQGDSNTMARPITFNLDPETPETGNLTDNEFLYYNLPLL